MPHRRVQLGEPDGVLNGMGYGSTDLVAHAFPQHDHLAVLEVEHLRAAGRPTASAHVSARVSARRQTP